MIYLHPAFQLLFLLLSAYVFFLGTRRFLSLHLKRKAAFPRKRHARLGIAAIAALYAGMMGGSLVVDARGLDPVMGATHGAAAAVMAVLMGLGAASGLFLYYRPKPRKKLPLAHGIANLLMLATGIVLAASGASILLSL